MGWDERIAWVFLAVAALGVTLIAISTGFLSGFFGELSDETRRAWGDVSLTSVVLLAIAALIMLFYLAISGIVTCVKSRRKAKTLPITPS